MNVINAELIIWDLDGTLIDSKKDIAYAVNETLERIDHPPISDEEIYSYVGNGVRPLIERAVAATGGGNSLDTAIRHFQEIYLAHLLDTTILFDGILDVLRHFENKKMAVASNKPYKYVVKILEGLHVADLFMSVKGGDSLPTRKPDPEMLNVILREAGIGANNAVFVGDSAVDIQTGKNAGVRTIGVSYGFRPMAELIASGPNLLVPTPEDLKRVIR
ncbi:MAG: HAD-IA family hydrolase [Nitrospinae bacterium]|nr:HAD-IA family hydrolase [Nitrospinota bacterium]